MIVGLPRSGKTTFIEEMKKQMRKRGETYVYVNAGDNFAMHNVEVARKDVYWEVNVGLEMGADYIILDGGFTSRKERRLFLKEFEGETIIANIMAVSYEDCIRNCEGWSEMEVEVNKAYKGIHIPLLAEGFNNVIYHTNTHELVVQNTRTYIEQLKEGLSFEDFVKYHPFKRWIRDYDQNNPYHRHTLDKHMYNVYSDIFYNEDLFDYTKFILMIAAAFHDIGKIHTREDKTPEHSTYYGHENVSAYEAVRVLARVGLPKEATDDIITVISNHMRFKVSKSEKVSISTKIKKELGEARFKLLEIFNKADIESK